MSELIFLKRKWIFWYEFILKYIKYKCIFIMYVPSPFWDPGDVRSCHLLVSLVVIVDIPINGNCGT